MTMTNEEIQAIQALARRRSAEWSDVLAADFLETGAVLDAGGALSCVADKVPTLCTDLLAAMAEIARLREALGPFAEVCKRHWNCAGSTDTEYVELHVPAGDLRRARTAMEDGK